MTGIPIGYFIHLCRNILFCVISACWHSLCQPSSDSSSLVGFGTPSRRWTIHCIWSPSASVTEWIKCDSGCSAFYISPANYEARWSLWHGSQLYKDELQNIITHIPSTCLSNKLVFRIKMSIRTLRQKNYFSSSW